MKRTRSTVISFVCKDGSGKILCQVGTRIGDCPVSIAENLAIQEVIRTAIRMNKDNIIVECDSQVAIGSITGRIVVPK